MLMVSSSEGVVVCVDPSSFRKSHFFGEEVTLYAVSLEQQLNQEGSPFAPFWIVTVVDCHDRVIDVVLDTSELDYVFVSKVNVASFFVTEEHVRTVGVAELIGQVLDHLGASVAT